ncbi:MAG: T9SS type A sorting domain-containing protein [Saprospiraceae bacterium]
MNFKKVLITALLFSPLNQLLAQYIPMVEEGKFWIYNVHSNPDFPSSESGHAITFLGDTIINSLNYKKVYKLELKGEHGCAVIEMPCWDFDYPYQTEEKKLISFIREDTTEQKVYNLPVSSIFCETEEHLIFDFSLDVGDSLNHCIYDFIDANDIYANDWGIVDSIKIIQRYGVDRPTLISNGIIYWQGLPIEGKAIISQGFGLDFYGIFHEQLTFISDFCEGEIDQCELILSASSIEKNNEVKIFPNPSKGVFHISLKEEKIEFIKVYSLLGELKSEFQNTDNIDISDFPNGVYFLELITKDKERLVKKVLKEN